MIEAQQNAASPPGPRRRNAGVAPGWLVAGCLAIFALGVFPSLPPRPRIVIDEIAYLGMARGLALAVLSNWDERLPRLLEGLGLGERFATVVYSQAVGVEKPHPAIFEDLLERLELPAARVLHVGDSRRDDVEGARAVGMEALWLTRDSQRGDLRSLRELAERLHAGPAPG